MQNEDTSFPQYRKLVNGRAYYKIVDDRHFEEIQLIGSRKQIFAFRATQYPEILKIQDLLTCFDDIYQVIAETEWLEIYK